ncbi:hypothetical protein GCM10023144_42020 [Pigmentiphaga soli]|uniref:histidine kinase n=1 Tax=Pigmentiphaga soli TaxID=1007095 RepID=A0ABP8HMK4_9BURK
MLRFVKRRLPLIVVPWVAVIALGFPLLWQTIDATVEGPLTRDRDDTLRESADILSRTIDNASRDTLFLSDVLGRLPAADEAGQSMLDALFATFAASSRAYERVRWIDERGRERIRVDSRNGGAALAAPAGQRQRERQPYFIGAAELPPGSVYLSAIQLNDEDGAVAQPHLPVLRVATPVLQAGVRRGVVVIDYQAGRLLQRLAGLSNRQGISVYLANDAGYWIHGPAPADDWAWQLGAPQRTLAQTHPGLWRAMRLRQQGVFDDRSGSWAFARFEPGGADAELPLAARDLDLYLLVNINPGQLRALAWRWQPALIVLMALTALSAAYYAVSMLRGMAKEERQRRELQAANESLAAANERLRSMQKDLVRAERLSSLGMVVAGVAHELNTPLGSATLALSTVRQHLATLRGRLAAGLRKSDLERFLQNGEHGLELAAAAIRRSSGIVQRFKQVAVDRSTMERRSFDLAQAIIDAEPRLALWSPDDPVALKLDLEPGLAMDSYPGPLGQVIANLLDNALKHAFADGSPGLITIRSRAQGAGHVSIRFSDNGAGIPEKNLQAVFEPFFTTSRHRGGTGLGLHISHQLVTEVLGGSIAALNQGADGRHGTTFVLHLPRRAPDRPPEAAG